MLINGNIKGKTYVRFIDYAVNKSDVFMLVVKHILTNIFDAQKHLSKFTALLPNHTVTQDIVERLILKESESKSDHLIFENECRSFLVDAEPHLIKRRHNPIWPSTEAVSKSTHDYDINFYTINPSTHKLLLKTDDYLDWCYPHLPDDLSFFKNGCCWAYSSSHEELINIIPDNYDEYMFLKEMGLIFYGGYEEPNRKEIFVEDY